MTKLVPPAMRRFGVEIECYGGWDVKLPPRWKVKEDSSLNMDGSEIVSPRLRTEDDFETLQEVCETLQKNCYVDRTCGLHVHHEVVDLPAPVIVDVAQTWAANQAAINMMINDDRIDNTWCRPFTHSHLDTLARMKEFEQYSWYQAPHGCLNLQSVEYYGTIEVRQHHGTLSFDEIESWVWFVRHLIDRVAKAAAPLGEQSPRQLLYRTRTPADKREYLARKVAIKEKFRAENGFANFSFDPREPVPLTVS